MIIDLCNVRFSYPKHPNSFVLDIPSWSLSSGEHTLIYGASGSGKSTFLNVLNGLLSANTGDVNVLNKDLNGMTERQRDSFRAGNIGYVFQQFNLIPYLDAIDNIRLANYFSAAKSAITDDIKALLTRLNIPEKDWKKPISKLSMGQQQRIAIARALINKPALLIADEPTSSLDPKNRDDFMALLMSIVNTSDTTLLFVSHDMSLAPYFNRTQSLSDINHAESINAN